MSFAESADVAARQAAHRAGVEAGDLQALRVGERAVFRLDGGRVIARVARHTGHHGTARREVQVARWLTSEGVAVTKPLDGEQPVTVDGLPVSLWHAVDGDWTIPADLAVVLRQLHALTPPAEVMLPDLDPFEHIEDRIERATAITSSDRETLRSIARDLRVAHGNVTFNLGRKVLHGDANIGNILKTADGEVVMFDLGGVCWGPPEWDLTITAVYRDLGWHTRGEYHDFASIYGYDVTAWSGYSVLRAVRELRMTCWLSQKAGDDDKIRREVRQRISDLTDPQRPRHWHPY